MEVSPKHDTALDLSLRFPGTETPPATTTTTTTTMATTGTATATASSAASYAKKHQKRTAGLQKQAGALASRSGGMESARRHPPAAFVTPAVAPRYTIYIRVPAPRNGFEDPPDVDWSQDKDAALWRILSRVSKNDIDWNDLADKFEAPVEFLLIQANVLTEKHLSQVRAQTRKVATQTQNNARESPAALSPMLAAGEAAMAKKLPVEAMRRAPSSGGRIGSSSSGIAMGKAGPAPVGSVSRPTDAAALRPASPANYDYSRRPQTQRRISSRTVVTAAAATEEEPPSPTESLGAASSSSSSSSSSSPSEPVMSRIFKRPPGYPQAVTDLSGLRGGGHASVVRLGAGGDVVAGGGGFGVGMGMSTLRERPGGMAASDDEDDSETQAAFLPFLGGTGAKAARPVEMAASSASSSASSSVASPRTRPFKNPNLMMARAGKGVISTSAASAASAARLPSSASSSRQPVSHPGIQSPPVLLHAQSSSGRRAAAGLAREGSDAGTTPSMGSSFSDLDDVSFTQSVLDEALASRVEDTMVSASSSRRTESLSLSANDTSTPTSTPGRRHR